MDKEKFVENFKVCKIMAIDIAYKETSLKLGANHTRNALKYILLNDKKHLSEEDLNKDKYLYISSRSGGRELLKLLDIYDVYLIILRFCMEMCAINDLMFTYIEIDNPKNVTDNKLVEYIAMLTFKDMTLGFNYIKDNKKILIRLLDSLIDNRYKNDQLYKLDNAYRMMTGKYLEVYNSLSSFIDSNRENTL